MHSLRRGATVVEGEAKLSRKSLGWMADWSKTVETLCSSAVKPCSSTDRTTAITPTPARWSGCGSNRKLLVAKSMYFLLRPKCLSGRIQLPPRTSMGSNILCTFFGIGNKFVSICIIKTLCLRFGFPPLRAANKNGLRAVRVRVGGVRSGPRVHRVGATRQWLSYQYKCLWALCG